jgi:hypothetical protein
MKREFKTWRRTIISISTKQIYGYNVLPWPVTVLSKLSVWTIETNNVNFYNEEGIVLIIFTLMSLYYYIWISNAYSTTWQGLLICKYQIHSIFHVVTYKTWICLVNIPFIMSMDIMCYLDPSLFYLDYQYGP